MENRDGSIVTMAMSGRIELMSDTMFVLCVICMSRPTSLSCCCTISATVVNGCWAATIAFTVVPGATPASFNSALAFFGSCLNAFTAAWSKYGDCGGTGENDGCPV